MIEEQDYEKHYDFDYYIFQICKGDGLLFIWKIGASEYW